MIYVALYLLAFFLGLANTAPLPAASLLALVWCLCKASRE